MIVLRVWRAQLLEIKEDALKTLATALPKALRPIISPARESQARVFGLLPELFRREEKAHPSPYGVYSQLVVDGEVFTDGINLFAIGIDVLDREGDQRTPRVLLQQGAVKSRRGQARSRLRLSLYYIAPTYDCHQLTAVETAVN